MALYVRTISAGTGPDVNLYDLGVTIATSATWTLLAAADGYGPENLAGQFTAIDIKESQDLYAALSGTPTLEWSTDGSTVRTDRYDMDTQLVIELQNNDWNMTFGRLTLPNRFTGYSDPRPGDLYYDADDGYIAFYDGTQMSYIALNESGSTNHGSLTGLGNDDHPQYLLLAGNAARNTVTGTVNISGGRFRLPSNVSPATNFTSPFAGELAYDSDDGYVVFYNGTAWKNVTFGAPHSSLTGLLNDDHTQYALLAGNAARNAVSGTFDFGDGYLIAPTYNIAPTTSVVDGAIVVVSGVLYVYDSVRSKWLSVHRDKFVTDRNANASTIYMRVGEGTATSTTGIRMARNGTITALTAQTDGAETWIFEVRKNDSVTVVASLTITAAAGATSNTVNVDVLAGDELQFYCNGSGIDHPVGIVEVAWHI